MLNRMLEKLPDFCNYSAKRQRLLDKAIDSRDSVPKARKLKDASRTRWVERIDSYIVS